MVGVCRDKFAVSFATAALSWQRHGKLKMALAACLPQEYLAAKARQISRQISCQNSRQTRGKFSYQKTK
jgi:hypothetical protein